MWSPFIRGYEFLVLRAPLITFSLLLLACLAMLGGIRHFQLDASSDSLVLESDSDLRYFRLVQSRYGVSNFLIISVTPQADLFDADTLALIENLRDELAAVPGVASVVSLLDVPLFNSPPVSLFAMGKDFTTLQMAEVDAEAARMELRLSPLYGDNLVSEDGSTTALQLNLRQDHLLTNMLRLRDELRARKYGSSLTQAEQSQLQALDEQIQEANQDQLERERQLVQSVRDIVAKYNDAATLYVGGIPLIVADMIRFIRNDLQVFGVGVLAMMMLTMWIIFRQWIWVLVPTLLSLLSSFMMMGMLGWLDWRVTVISSNFFSLLLIMTLSIVIHLVVRYRELQREGLPKPDGLKETLRSMFLPCLFTSLTTVIAFGSLIVSDIRPVIDFGWTMAMGVMLGLVLSFLLFPVLIRYSPVPVAQPEGGHLPFSAWFAGLTERHGGKLLVLGLVAMGLSVLGMQRLSVENRFIDYFKADTEIHQGMKQIDQELGGTTPLEVVIDGLGEDYWRDPFIREQVKRIHLYLDARGDVGKVQSIDTFMQVMEEVNFGMPLDNFYLGMMQRQLPDLVKEQLVAPYLSNDNNQVRFVMRVRESDPSLHRQVLIDEIRAYLLDKEQLREDQVHITGMLVLYNNMLQSLFQSQIMTIGAVLAAVAVMFVILFRSIKLAIVGIIPNLLPSSLILGVMGWLAIPLDMMTITIAAIAIGIGVDDTIHYIHRFKRELKRDGDYHAAMHRSHRSIGRAMLYTSVIITAGFSVLMLSNFIPTVYFGLFTGFAMLAALLANLTLLPALLVKWKPIKA